MELDRDLDHIADAELFALIIADPLEDQRTADCCLATHAERWAFTLLRISDDVRISNGRSTPIGNH